MTLTEHLLGTVPRWVWATLIILHLAFMGWGLAANSWVFPDSDRYVEAAYNISVHNELYSKPWPLVKPAGQMVQEFTIRPPGYPLLALLFEINTLERVPIRLLVFQNLISLVNIGFVLRYWGRRANPKQKQWILALLLLLFPAQFIYANALMSELLLQVTVMFISFYGILVWNKARTWYVVAVVIASCVAFLTKPVFYPFAGVCTAFIAGIAWRHRRPDWAIWGGMPIVVAVIYMYWNCLRTGYFHFSSIAEINLLHYNAAGVLRHVIGSVGEQRWVETTLKEANSQLDFAARQQLIQNKAAGIIREYPLIYARQHLQGIVAFFLDPGRFDISMFFKLPSFAGGLLEQLRSGGALGMLQALWRLPLGLLLVLALVAAANATRVVLAVKGFWLVGANSSELSAGRWWLAGLILYVAFLTGPLGAARFLVPVWPLLLLLALCGIKPVLPLAAQQDTPVGEPQG